MKKMQQAIHEQVQRSYDESSGSRITSSSSHPLSPSPFRSPIHGAPWISWEADAQWCLTHSTLSRFYCVSAGACGAFLRVCTCTAIKANHSIWIITCPHFLTTILQNSTTILLYTYVTYVTPLSPMLISWLSKVYVFYTAAIAASTSPILYWYHSS